VQVKIFPYPRSVSGPSGGTCAFYLAKGGKRVLLLDKEKFPRDKVCGNTINTTAQYHLKEMGVLQEILSELGLSKWVTRYLLCVV
jgi:flavin-dependent dehydrogenase